MHHIVTTTGGYGALIVGDIPPEPPWEMTSYLTADGRDVSGPPPPARTFTKQIDPAQLAAIDDGGPQFTEQMAKDIRQLRNLHEHWDEQKPSFAHPSLTKDQSGKDFADRHPAERPWEFKFGSGGHWISVLRLEDLWDELELIDRNLGRLSNAELAGTATPHIIEDENRPLRPIPQPGADRTLARSMLRQPIRLGGP